MKLRISAKVFLVSFFLIVVTIFSTIILNNIYLEKYYLYKKGKQLEKISKIIPDENATTEEIFQLENSYGVIIDVIELDSLKSSLGHFLTIDEKNVYQELLNKGNSVELSQYMGIKHIMFYRLMDSRRVIRVMTSIHFLDEEVRIANEFYLYIGFIVLGIGAIVSFLFSKTLVKPILKINRSIKKIAKMDFSEKIDLKTNDELDEVATSINFLSEKLEETIDNLNNANIKLKEDINKEKRIDEMRKKFISNVAHEIKTPVTVINSYAEVLGELSNQNHKNYTEIIIEEGKNISKLLDDLIGLIKLESEGETLNIENFNILELIKNNLKKYRLDLDEKKIGVILESYGQNEIEVIGDKFKIGQVINNFLSNAISHVNIGGNIKVNLYKKLDKIVVEIMNTGSKVPMEHIESIWDPFYKSDEARTRKYGGTGLGLAISKGILDRHKSNYGVVNIDKGVKFWFDISFCK